VARPKAKRGDPIRTALTRGLSGEAVADPPLKRLIKGEAATGGPAAGRATATHALRRGPLGFLQLLGPGLITGASDDDPSGIGTYSQVGSQFGYGLLWTALLTFPLMASVQELCARIALETGSGLGTALRRKFPAWLVGIAVAALCIANVINIGADLGAVAAGASLLSGEHIGAPVFVIPVAMILLGLQLFTAYSTIFRIFKCLTLALLAYVVTAFFSHPDAVTVLGATFIPHVTLTPAFLAALVAVLGTTISPYLFFWQASSEVDEMKAAGRRTVAKRRDVRRAELRSARLDILTGMGFSQLIMYCIILVAGTVLHARGATGVATAQQAAQALSPIAGSFASILFAIGLIGTGLLAIPILSASAAYAVKEVLGLHGSLAVKPRYRPTFYGIIVVATLVGLLLSLLHVNPIQMLFATAVINGLVAPPLLALIVLLGSDRTLMRSKRSGALSRWLTWIATAAMSAAAAGLVLSFLVLRSG
jgi:NRAMP (natural resistance-associated macrophage protein)-like metal ion transporter